MTKPKEKTFDCLEFKYKAQERIYKIIKDFSPEEEIAYFNNKAKEGPFRDFVASLQKKPKSVQVFEE
jgi:hypothetical protein